MRKVMAADDEGYVRDALRQLIPWQSLGCELCQVVTNGRELIDEMEQSHPDIIITDIRMPQVDGLEVCKYVYDHCPESQVIILSAYSDFTYARTALRYGACEYVLKIEMIDELPKAIEKAVKELDKQSKEVLEESPAEETPDDLYAQMVRYVERNYRKNITLQDIADELHANQSYLSRLYKTCSGVNLFDDIQRRRIAKAKERLLTSDWKVQAVAEYVGFEDSAYFSRVFKKETGMSPKEYRNAYEKNN